MQSLLSGAGRRSRFRDGKVTRSMTPGICLVAGLRSGIAVHESGDSFFSTEDSGFGDPRGF